MKTLTTLMMFAVLSIGCGKDGGGNSAGPSPVPTPPPPAAPVTITITGRVTATISGQAIPDVQAVLGATTATTDGSGSFSAAVAPTGSLLLSLTGSGIVPRSLQVAASGNRDLAVNAIAIGSGFDLNFYRQFVRDATESPTLQPLRRWTTNPSIYLQANGLVDARTLAMIESVARAAVPAWTNGQLAVAAVERGPDTRVGQPGWITVLFSPETTHCGLSDIGLSGGTVTFYPKVTACGCSGYPMRPTAVRHEFGHAMGFFHTDSTADVMNAVANQCDTQLSARERYHSAIAYARPVGNQDPDTDPGSVVSLAPMRVQQ